MRTVAGETAAGWLLIRPHGRPSFRQTEEKSLKVIITAERMSAGPLGSMTAPGPRAGRGVGGTQKKYRDKSTIHC